jgi:hypothetical protein
MGNFKGSDDYIDVKERLQDFLDAYPHGTLQTVSWEVLTVTGLDEGPKSSTKGKEVTRTFIVYQAAAYRTPDDPRPGIAMSYEPFPGHTNFTLNSELENAETSAWGRAIVACGVAANKSLASRQEVRNRVMEQEAIREATDAPAKTAPAKAAPAPRVPKLTGEERSELGLLYVSSGWDQKTLAMQLVLIDAMDATSVEALGSNPSDSQYADLIGPAMSALSREQYETVKAALEAEVAKVDAAAVAARS